MPVGKISRLVVGSVLSDHHALCITVFQPHPGRIGCDSHQRLVCDRNPTPSSRKSCRYWHTNVLRGSVRMRTGAASFSSYSLVHEGSLVSG